MGNIISVKGKVRFPITLDPGVWIFDDRRIDLDTFFEEDPVSTNELEEYTKSISKHWDREIMEGAIMPPTLNTEKKYEKEKVLTGSFGISLEPFIKNAEPQEDAKTIVIETLNQEYPFPIQDQSQLILGFSNKGKPLRDDGPVYVYLRDGSNKKSPIKNVRAFRID
ncbi:peptidyl-prolyl cis-trans isomerase [Cytobacillus sp. Hz8]|uniref:peptidyl-prolyl cis-trans isomerase n=1 Tax=Cytobacillus sp. Hz8 TaxID=3347168 RepID=UPI0035DCE452